jgi:hypothetical protein
MSAELAIDTPRELTFDFLSDLANRPSFTDHFIADFHLLRLDSVGLGAGARFRFFAPPQARWMDTTVVDLERPHRISERGRGGRANRIPAATEWELIAGPGALTIVRVTFWTETRHPLDRAKEVMGWASIWYRRDWQAALRRLRDLLEAGEPPARRALVAGSAVSSPRQQ